MEVPSREKGTKPIGAEELWNEISRLPAKSPAVKEIEVDDASESGLSAIDVAAKETVAAGAKADVADDAVAAVATDTSPSATALQSSSKSLRTTGSATPVPSAARFPHNIPHKTGLFLGQNGKAYFVVKDFGNPEVVGVGSKRANNLIRKLGQVEGITLRKTDLNDINHFLQAEAESSRVSRSVWYRVAEVSGGVEIDLGDEDHTRVRITADKVEVVTSGSEALFYRTPVSRPMVMPAEVGDLNLLKKYLNLHPVQMLLFIAWVSYTLARPKNSASKYLILVLQGNQGSGKSFLCWIIMMLIDPSQIGVQLLPSNPRDLAIAAQNAHVLCYDNLRELSHNMSDILCTAATGGAISNRQLYSDADQNVLQLHVAIVLNGIHSFIDQPDLAQRCLPLTLKPFDERKRISEAQLKREFMADLPGIMCGLFDLIAKICKRIPTAEVTNPERMIDFVHWLAAMERVDGGSAGIYQALYSDVLQQGQLDSLLDNTLAAVVMELAEAIPGGKWSGTPAALLLSLNKIATPDIKRSREWPQNPIALSKRLHPLQASLLTQGINIEFTREKERKITITAKNFRNTNGKSKELVGDDDGEY